MALSGGIDLHSHTQASDGELSPDALFQAAAGAGLSVLAVTDHDTVAGLAECERAAARWGLRLVPGLELSTTHHGREVHLLGHFVDPASSALAGFERRFVDDRRERMVKMVARACALGLPVTLDEVVSFSGGELLCRPHLAKALLARGHVKSVKEAFDRYLRDGAPVYVDRLRPDLAEAIALVHEAGGTASIAHPGLNSISEQELRELAELPEGGLDAVEALHPDHVPSQAEAYSRWADELGMLITAGSDFHGPGVRADRHLGDRTLDPELFLRLEERAARLWSGRP
jgi:predicted metal-dependent phosphoesterase TrpH